jgi:DNA-binding response OmpR family regulator/class 3 adenylate cyclase
MATQKIERRLAAILAADGVGYSRLMSLGEEAALQRLKMYRTVINGLIGEHHGRIFGSAGDSVIAEFPSSIEAVHCAVAIQQALHRRNAELPPERRMAFRIGVNLGEVMIEDDNLFGDAVNVAARLEGLAESGGICISDDVYHHIKNKLELGFEDLGEREVKNIPDPVHVYRVIVKPGADSSGKLPAQPTPARARITEGGEPAEVVRILVVDDDPDVRDFLHDYLSEHGYEVFEADSAEAMRAFVAERVPDVVLLDVGLPGEDGLSLARYLRERFDIGIIMISGAGETVDRIVGLEIGADDYVTKPFEPRELLARLKCVLRRYHRSLNEQAAPASASEPPAESPSHRVAIGPCLLDLDSHLLFGADGKEIALTSMEFDLLKVFVERPNRPLSRDQLLDLTQNRDWDPFDRSIDIRIARLRRKIEPNPDKPQIIKTVRGVGYMFAPKTG